MGTIEGRFFSATGFYHSSLLSKHFGSFADSATVSLDSVNGRQIVTSGRPDLSRSDVAFRTVRAARGDLSVSSLALGAADLSHLLTASLANEETEADNVWEAFRCRFSCGVEDVIALRNVENPDEVCSSLQIIWPGLRRACVGFCEQSSPDLSADAMLWMIGQKVNASILAMDQQCRVLRANAAAEELLAERRLLRNTPTGLICANHSETQALRAAVRESYETADQNGCEYILILRGRSGTAHVPLSLSTYLQVETGARLILAMLPMPPDSGRIEGLARQMGLTPSEARVAALIREGHSNREAAKIAGLKVETFNTYAKRVLSKMNVKGRAEMAQMLTWQAALERPL